ncbi:MAG: hypothetical protein LBE48_05325 [Methanomassiliicoccaceae archaeon]|jgi:hypothetical protein|nr:hypothetical protein [Methanomassiliicoccaceae archaeon]
MRDKGPIIIAVVVLAVILETGLIGMMDNKTAEGTFDDISSAAEDGITGSSEDPMDKCGICLIDADGVHDHYADLQSNCQKNICGEHMFVKPSEFPTTSWNFKSKWKVTAGMSSAFRSAQTVEVTFYSDGYDQAAEIMLGHDEGSAASALNRQTFNAGCAGSAGMTEYAWGDSMNTASVLNERGLMASI